MRQRKPKFEEPNLDAVQVCIGGAWMDYASIKTAADMRDAVAMVDGNTGRPGRATYRIVRCKMGKTLIYG